MKISLRQPDDWHLHLRDGVALEAVVGFTARQFKRAIVMPNLDPPVTDLAAAVAYRERILAALPADTGFEPLMTLYLTEDTTPEQIRQAQASGLVFGVKLYPAGATTNSARGVRKLANVMTQLATLAEIGLPLQVHGEVVDPEVDIFDREAVFLERELAPALEKLPGLKVVVEHVSTRAAVDFVSAAGPNVAATVTPQHLLLTRNDLLAGGLRPHHYCLPILKRETDRTAILNAATGDSNKFFLGTDSAPHSRASKQSACGCAGVFSAAAALEYYATAFESVGALEKLEAFASLNGPRFYGLEPNKNMIQLTQTDWQLPETYPMGDAELVPLWGGNTLSWRYEALQ